MRIKGQGETRRNALEKLKSHQGIRRNQEELKRLGFVLKGESCSLLDMLDLLFKFPVLSCESFQKASAFSQCEDVAPLAGRQWTKTHCQGRYQFRCLIELTGSFFVFSNLTVTSVYKIGFIVAVYCIAVEKGNISV